MEEEVENNPGNFGPIPEQLVTTPQELEECCNHLSDCRRFGLDTEFVGEDSYHPRLCLVQVATEESLYLIDPVAIGSLDPFWRVVTDPRMLVIVHAGREEIRLCKLWSGSAPGNVFDLQIAAALAGYSYPLGHANLVQQILGIRLSKGETLTEWRNRPLTKSQIRYAFDDVRYLLALWEKLATNLDHLGRLSWAQEEFGRLKENSSPDDRLIVASGEKWRKIKGAGSLERRQLATLRALFDWREESAARSNRPARTILRDDLLVELSRRNPKRPKDLQVVRGVQRHSLDSIFETIESSRGIPLDQCPELSDRQPEPAQVGLLTHILSAVLVDLSGKKRLASNFVAGNQDLKLLARALFQSTPIPPACILKEGWRAEHILPELMGILEGKIAIRIGNIKSLSPLIYTSK